MINAVITQETLQAQAESAWELAMNKRPAIWKLRYMQDFEIGRDSVGCATHNDKRKSFLGLADNNITLFDRSIMLIGEQALYSQFESYARKFRPVQFKHYIPHKMLEYSHPSRDKVLREMQEETFGLIKSHMGAGVIFISSHYLEWLGGMTVMRASFNRKTYQIIESPYIEGVIADPQPIECSVRVRKPAITLSEKRIIIDYQIAFNHPTIHHVLTLQDEIQANWRYQNA